LGAGGDLETRPAIDAVVCDVAHLDKDRARAIVENRVQLVQIQGELDVKDAGV